MSEDLRTLIQALEMVDSYYYQPYVDQHGLTEHKVQETVEAALRKVRMKEEAASSGDSKV